MNEFEQADTDAGVAVVVPEVDSEPQADSVAVAKREETLPSSHTLKLRQTLLAEYHEGAANLVEKLKKNGRTDIEALLVALIDEIVNETDNLLGNELVATHNGDLRDATIISAKRSDILEKAIRAVQAKMEFEKESGIDIDSPSMLVIIRFFMGKTKQAFEQMGAPDEQSDLFFRTLGEMMEDWKKELREQFEELRTPRG